MPARTEEISVDRFNCRIGEFIISFSIIAQHAKMSHVIPIHASMEPKTALPNTS